MSPEKIEGSSIPALSAYSKIASSNFIYSSSSSYLFGHPQKSQRPVGVSSQSPSLVRTQSHSGHLGRIISTPVCVSLHSPSISIQCVSPYSSSFTLQFHNTVPLYILTNGNRLTCVTRSCLSPPFARRFLSYLR